MAELSVTERKKREEFITEKGLILEVILSRFPDRLPPVDTMESSYGYVVDELGMEPSVIEDKPALLSYNSESLKPKVDHLVSLGISLNTSLNMYNISMSRIELREAFLRDQGISSFVYTDFQFPDKRFLDKRGFSQEEYDRFKQSYKA